MYQEAPPDITPELLLQAYRMGVFPMADHKDDPDLFWVTPKQRGIMPLEGFHISRSLARSIRHGGFITSVNQDFAGVIDGCAARDETWISTRIRALYLELHAMGHAHSLEVWHEGALAGGVYGISIGAAFMGESMFSRRTDASKVALAWLTHRLRAGGYQLLDTQFLTAHLQSLGAIEIPQAKYLILLKEALKREACFTPEGYAPLAEDIAAYSARSKQRSTQTS